MYEVKLLRVCGKLLVHAALESEHHIIRALKLLVYEALLLVYEALSY